MLSRVLYKRSTMLSARAFSSKIALPDLPWEIGSLEPTISGYLLDYHYNKHHNAYVTNLNNLLQQLGEAQEKKDTKTILKVLPGVKFNTGGHVNHDFFWNSLAPKTAGGGERPSESGAFGKEVLKTWGSFDNLIKDFNARTTGIMGSGWGWICWDTNMKTLRYTQSKDQDLITEQPGLVPLLNVDVWEHAYYLDYKNSRPEFLKNIWDVVNWLKVEKRFNEAIKK